MSSSEALISSAACSSSSRSNSLLYCMYCDIIPHGEMMQRVAEAVGLRARRNKHRVDCSAGVML